MLIENLFIAVNLDAFIHIVFCKLLIMGNLAKTFEHYTYRIRCVSKYRFLYVAN